MAAAGPAHDNREFIYLARCYGDLGFGDVPTAFHFELVWAWSELYRAIGVRWSGTIHFNNRNSWHTPQGPQIGAARSNNGHLI